MRDSLIAAAVQYCQYTVLTVNFRAIAHREYAFAGATASLAAFLSAVMVRRVVKDNSWHTVAGAMVGGGLADMCGIWLTRHWGG